MARGETVRCRLTVCFEEPFWIGYLERTGSGRYAVCRVTFGAEPTDAEEYDFLLKNAYGLPFSPAVAGEPPPPRAANPRRMQREARRQMRSAAIGARARQALKLQHEQSAEARKTRRKEQNEAKAERRFLTRQEKSGRSAMGTDDHKKHEKGRKNLAMTGRG